MSNQPDFISWEAAEANDGIKRPHRYKLIAKGLHPAPVKIAARKSAFIGQEYRAHIAAKMAGARSAKSQHNELAEA